MKKPAGGWHRATGEVEVTERNNVTLPHPSPTRKPAAGHQASPGRAPGQHRARTGPEGPRVSDRSEVKWICLLESLDRGRWLKLPLAVMQDVGPAVQTFGGILALSTRETYAQVAKIAERARLPLKRTRQQLAKLEARGWIDNKGRQPGKGGGRRLRTCTLALTTAAKEALSDSGPGYGALPLWAAGPFANGDGLDWSARAVLAVILMRLMEKRPAAEALPYGDAWENLSRWGPGEWEFPLSATKPRGLMRLTGLSRASVVAAKRKLWELRIVRTDWYDPDPAKKIARWDDGGRAIDWLQPNGSFRVAIRDDGTAVGFDDFSTGLSPPETFRER